MEMFVLDQIDGQSGVEALAELTMLSASSVRRMLVRLAGLGLIGFEHPPAQPVAPPPAAPEALEEASDIDPARAQRIDSVTAHLGNVTHYELIGVPADADKNAIKKAYFVLSKEFHPDTLHGKRVAAYKLKMETIFRRVTDAYDVLSRQRKRSEYDAELARTKRKPFALTIHPPSEPPANTSRAVPTGGEGRVEPASSASTPRPGAAGATSGSSGAIADPNNAGASPAHARPVSPPSSAGVPRPTPPSGAATSPLRTPASSVGVPRPPGPAAPGAPVAPGAAAAAAVPIAPATTSVRGVTGSSVETSHAIPAPTSSISSARPVTVPNAHAAGTPSGLRAPSGPGASRPASLNGAPRPTSSAGGVPVPSASTTSPGTVRTPSASVSHAYGERIARDIARQTGKAISAVTPVDTESHSTADRERSLLRALHGANQLTGQVDRVGQYERQAISLEAAGDLSGALSCLTAALHFDAARTDIRVEHDRLDRLVAAGEAPTLRMRARNEERNAKHEAAMASWRRVCLGVPDDFEANVAVARCVLDGGLDLRIGRDHAQKSVDLRPTELEPRILLARIFHGAGMRLNALRELETAAKLDPGNQLVKNLQREFK